MTASGMPLVGLIVTSIPRSQRVALSLLTLRRLERALLDTQGLVGIASRSLLVGMSAEARANVLCVIRQGLQG